MVYLIEAYWPFILIALGVGAAVGWWFQDPRSADDATVWLERGPDEQ